MFYKCYNRTHSGGRLSTFLMWRVFMFESLHVQDRRDNVCSELNWNKDRSVRCVRHSSMCAVWLCGSWDLCRLKGNCLSVVGCWLWWKPGGLMRLWVLDSVHSILPFVFVGYCLGKICLSVLVCPPLYVHKMLIGSNNNSNNWWIWWILVLVFGGI